MYKKFLAGRQTNANMPQQQLPRQESRVQQRTSGTQSKDGNWDFKEGQNPLG